MNQKTLTYIILFKRNGTRHEQPEEPNYASSFVFRLHLHARHEPVFLSFLKQPVELFELQQGLGHGRRLRFVGQVVQSLEHVLEGHASQSVNARRDKRGREPFKHFDSRSVDPTDR